MNQWLTWRDFCGKKVRPNFRRKERLLKRLLIGVTVILFPVMLVSNIYSNIFRTLNIGMTVIYLKLLIVLLISIIFWKLYLQMRVYHHFEFNRNKIAMLMSIFFIYSYFSIRICQLES